MSEHNYKRRWKILVVVSLAQLMVVLDATITNIALPSAQVDLGFNADIRGWIVTAYALAFGSLLLLGGRLGDLFGFKRAFVGGLAGFSIASVVGGLAPSFAVLVGARAAQGVFAALLAPAALALLATTFTEPGERGKAFGVFGAVSSAGGGIGVLLGGVLTESLSWRWALYVNAFIAVPVAIAALRLLEAKRPSARPRLDLPGAFAATAGFSALVYGFSNSELNSWGHPMTAIALASAAVLIGAFFVVQRRSTHPLLPLRVIADRTRGGAFIAVALTGSGIFAAFLFLSYFMQQNLGYSPIKTGLGFLPLSVTIMITAPQVSGRLLGRVGPRVLMASGMGFGALSMLWLTQLSPDSAYAATILPSLVLLGLALSSIFAPAFATATHGIAPADAGVAAASVTAMQQLGGAAGVALLSSVVASAAGGFAEGKARSAEVLGSAAVHGYTIAFGVTAGVYLIGAVAVLALVPDIRAGGPVSSPVAEEREAVAA